MSVKRTGTRALELNEERRDELNQVDEVQRVGDSVSEGRKK